jgi:hypothetical protein
MSETEKCQSCKLDFPVNWMRQFDSEIDHAHARWVQLCPYCLDRICIMLGYEFPYPWDQPKFHISWYDFEDNFVGKVELKNIDEAQIKQLFNIEGQMGLSEGLSLNVTAKERKHLLKYVHSIDLNLFNYYVEYLPIQIPSGKPLRQVPWSDKWQWEQYLVLGAIVVWIDTDCTRYTCRVRNYSSGNCQLEFSDGHIADLHIENLVQIETPTEILSLVRNISRGASL